METFRAPSNTLRGHTRKLEREFLHEQVVKRQGEMALNQMRVRFRLDIRKTFFPVKMVHHWSMLPREGADDLSLETSKARLDEALSNLG